MHRSHLSGVEITLALRKNTPSFKILGEIVSFLYSEREMNIISGSKTRLNSLFATKLVNRPADIAEIDDVVERPIG